MDLFWVGLCSSLLPDNRDGRTAPDEVIEEEAADHDEGTSLGEELPSGDELAAELEKFLRGEGS